MSKIKVHQFDPIIYPYKLCVVCSADTKVISDNFNERNGQPMIFINSDTKMSKAFVAEVAQKETNLYGSVILFRSKKGMTVQNMAHESSHAAKFLFSHIGADIREHEPFEYVLGWIADCCEQVKTNKFK